MRAAMRKVDITPTHDVYTDGYSPSLAKYPENFNSDLMARILVIEDDSTRAVHLNLEIVYAGFGFNLTEKFRDDIAAACDTTPDQIIVSNTHNHQAMPTLDADQENKIINTAREMCKHLAPVAIGADIIGTKYGTSRSPNYNIDPDGPYDNAMTVIRFDNADTNEPMGLIYSVPIHNTMYGNGPGNKEHWDQFTCEFTGYTSRYIERAKKSDNENFTAMHINGFYGNSGPLYNDLYYATTIPELKTAGEALGAEVLGCYENIVSEMSSGSVYSGYSEDRMLRTNPVDRRFVEHFRHAEAFPPKFVPSANDDFPVKIVTSVYDAFPVKIVTSVFGECIFVGVNYEAFSITGAHLKAESPYRYVLPAANVNGWWGYIPTKEVFNNGRFEKECQPWKTGFTEDTEALFYSYLIDTVCQERGVSLSRTPSTPSQPVSEDGCVVYSFDFSEEITPDKLVVSFGQKARSDCASRFSLELYDNKGSFVHKETVSDNSVNYLGFFLENVSFSQAKVIVEEVYGGGDINRLPISVHGVHFTKK